MCTVDLGLRELFLGHLVVAGETGLDDLDELALLLEGEEGVREDLGLGEGDLHEGAVVRVEEVVGHVLELKVVGAAAADELLNAQGLRVEDFGLKVNVEVAGETTEGGVISVFGGGEGV